MRDHLGQYSFGRVKHGFEIDRQQFLPGLFVAFDEGLQSIPALAVDQNIDLTEARENFVHHAIDIGLLGQIDLAGNCVHAESLNLDR